MSKILTNLTWKIGQTVLVDVSTRRYPRKVALVDQRDWAKLTATSGRWFAAPGHRTFYAARNHPRTPRPRKRPAFLHQAMFRDEPAPSGTIRDHRNGDGLDNRRSNLRPATHQQNLFNAAPQLGRTSRFRGVSWNKKSQKWTAQIVLDAKTRRLGAFDNEEDGARAYDQAAIAHFGSFARLNFGGARV